MILSIDRLIGVLDLPGERAALDQNYVYSNNKNSAYSYFTNTHELAVVAVVADTFFLFRWNRQWVDGPNSSSLAEKNGNIEISVNCNLKMGHSAVFWFMLSVPERKKTINTTTSYCINNTAKYDATSSTYGTYLVCSLEMWRQ